MTISFVVETGSGSSTSTSYATVAQFKQYWENRGTSFTDADSAIQGYLNTATEYIDINYMFRGVQWSSSQALQWPRHGICDAYGNLEVDDCSIPQKLIDATCYMAAQAKSATLMPADEGISSESYGPISKTYSRAGRRFPACDAMLKNLLISGGSLVRIN